MGAMHQAVSMQDFEIFPDGDLGSVEFPGHVRDQHTAVPFQNFDDGPSAFFVEHVFSDTRAYDCAFFLYRLLSAVQSKQSSGTSV
jgi:hypothetical protein